MLTDREFTLIVFNRPLLNNSFLPLLYGIEADRDPPAIAIVARHFMGQPSGEDQHGALFGCKRNLRAADGIALAGQQAWIEFMVWIDVDENEITTVMRLIDVVNAAEKTRFVIMELG
jgi:hypothetical protein